MIDAWSPPSQLEKQLYLQCLRHLGQDPRWEIVWEGWREPFADGDGYFFTLGECSASRLVVSLDALLPPPLLYATALHEFGHAHVYYTAGLTDTIQTPPDPTPAAMMTRSEFEHTYRGAGQYRTSASAPGDWNRLRNPTPEKLADRLGDIFAWYAEQQTGPDASIAKRLATLAQFPMEDATK